ncbi:hypothetical protein DMC47_16320 [Nostoc sp. 3335mG]|nr:hypothetical protein DMC47_16320 [Nostoc sp. 3335mG]
MAAPEAEVNHQFMDLLYRVPPNLFAAVDGAHFDNLPAALRERQLSSRPLYLEAESPQGVLAGPHLVPLHDMAAASRLLVLLGGKPAAVFWSWPGDIDTMQRHLRTINMVEIPAPDRPEGFEPVLFRHADPNVIALITPLLSAAQLGRLLGQAAGLAGIAPEHGGIFSLPRPDGAAGSAGFLRLTPEQYAAIDAHRLERSRRKVMDYLRNTAPDHTRHMDDAQLAAAVMAAEGSANSYGIVSERGHAQWAYLTLITGDSFHRQPGFSQYMTDGAQSPDFKIDATLRSLAILQTQRERRG